MNRWSDQPTLDSTVLAAEVLLAAKYGQHQLIHDQQQQDATVLAAKDHITAATCQVRLRY